MIRAMAIGVGLGLAVLAAPAREARACGDTGGDGGSSSSGSSSSSGGGSDYSSSYSSVYVPPCEDGSNVVGYRTCSPYGSWAMMARMPKVSMEVGMWSSMVDLSGIDVGGTMTHDDGTSYNYRVVGSELGNQADVVGVRMRMAAHHRGLYLGLEGGIGGVVADDPTHQTPMDRVDLSSETGAVAVGGVVLGGRVFAGRVSAGGEIMAGVRGVSVATTSTHGACIVEDIHWTGEPTVEVRARGDLWLTPWITAGAYLGRDALGGQTSGGIDLGVHFRAFDGR